MSLSLSLSLSPISLISIHFFPVLHHAATDGGQLIRKCSFNPNAFPESEIIFRGKPAAAAAAPPPSAATAASATGTGEEKTVSEAVGMETGAESKAEAELATTAAATTADGLDPATFKGDLKQLIVSSEAFRCAHSAFFISSACRACSHTVVLSSKELVTVR
jgi:hypothetical protein